MISETNEQLGIISFEDALNKAAEAGLDLVEMAGKVEPPVCRIMDFGKYQYQEDKRQRNAKKNQIQQKIKEVKFHLHIDDNDFETKVRHSIEFLQKGDKVKVLLAYRGREMSHMDLGQQLMNRIVQAIGENAIIDSPAKLLGKNCQMMLAPNLKAKKKAMEGQESKKAEEPESKA